MDAQNNSVLFPQARTLDFARTSRFLALALMASVVFGCGSKTATVEPATANSSTTDALSQPREMQPQEVVSQFLDRVRRGGNDSGSNELLTKLAQQELTRIGRPFEFPGSPDTVFEVKDAFQVPDQKDAVWVLTNLSEPVNNEQSVKYEVVWMLRKESIGWRVSGFVIDQGDGLEPLEFDFENGDQMAAKLTALEQPDAPAQR